MENINMPLILALYLPQFHRVKENDEWWGEGFTEWTAVKNAKPLFRGHNQPEVPLNNNYYDLLNKDTIKWQADLAKKYLIDGFCIYHYWFKDGKKILEKPVENLLKWSDIDINYCFCWPVESWVRTWTAIGNRWTTKFAIKTQDKNNDDYLLKQDFGTEEDWKKHFMYLLPFFKDKRYIKIDNKPIFYFHFYYAYGDMLIYDRMVLYWKKLAKENGFDGVYVINMDCPRSASDAVVRRFPTFTAKKLTDEIYNNLNVYSYSELWKQFLGELPFKDKPTLWECKVNYDTTPRNSEKGIIFQGFEPEILKTNLTKLLKKAIAINSPIFFLNAWNEWGEGMHLEPDEKYKYKIIESVKEAILDAKNTINLEEEKKALYTINPSTFYKLEEEKNKLELFYNFLYKLTIFREKNINLGDYLYNKGYKNIAIYGFGKHGKILYNEILNSKINCVYAIDKLNTYKQHENIPILGFNDKWPKVDVIIVSVIDKYIEIYNEICNKVKCPIISLNEIF